MGLVSGLLISIVAYTLVRPHHIFTDTVAANTTCSGAFVYIFAGLFVGSEFVPGWAIAAIRAWCINAGSTATQTWDSFTFVNIWKKKIVYVGVTVSFQL